MKKKKHKDYDFLTTLIEISQKHIKNNGSDLDKLFKDQADRLRKQRDGLA